MASNQFLLSLLLIGLISAVTSTAALLGGYEPIKDLNDPYLIGVAKFAVSEENKVSESTQLVFVKIVSGQKMIARGATYNLVINAKIAGSGAGGDFLAVVYDMPWKGFRRLDAFGAVPNAKN